MFYAHASYLHNVFKLKHEITPINVQQIIKSILLLRIIYTQLTKVNILFI